MLKKAVDRAIIKIGGNFILKKGRRKWRSVWRVPERSLFLPALLGGALGGVLGMQVFRHKTRHWYFRFGFPLLLIVQLAGLLWLARRAAG